MFQFLLIIRIHFFGRLELMRGCVITVEIVEMLIVQGRVSLSNEIFDYVFLRFS